MQISLYQRAILSIDWLLEANRVCKGLGFAHSWSPIFGWKPAYPETTGYIIPTLLDANNNKRIRAHYAAKEVDLQDIAIKQVQWLSTLQLGSGAFPGLLAGNKTPSVFNTGMILFGLSRVLLLPPSANFATHSTLPDIVVAAVRYLYDLMDTDGLWRKDTYITGFSPTYHVYALYGMLEAAEALRAIGYRNLDSEAIEQKATLALHTYAKKWNPDGSIKDCGFWSGKPAFTHTIGYALDGMLHASLLLHQQTHISLLETSAQNMEKEYQLHKKLAGSFGPNGWKGDYRFTCVTGHIQIAIMLRSLAAITNKPAYATFADKLMSDIYTTQLINGTARQRGALPGSVPLYGPYLRFRYPNWAAKYFLDAILPILEENA